MFEIKILVEDNKLAKALVALDGMGYNLSVTPVKNAVAAPKTRTPRTAMEAGHPINGSEAILTLLSERLKEDPNFTSFQLSEALHAAKIRWGATPAQIYNGAIKLVKDGFIHKKDSVRGAPYYINPEKFQGV